MDNPLVDDYLAAKARYENAKADYEELEARLVKQMEADQRKSYRWNADGTRYNLTYVQGHTTLIDEVGLRRAMKAKNFDRYTKRVLDRKAMEAAIDAGEVDKVLVARFVTLRPNKPHLAYRATPVKEEE